jgi:type III secretion protein R
VSLSANPLATMALLAALSVLPFAVLMLTCFSKVAVVLSLARSGLGLQQSPPTMVLTGLAAVLTAHIMTPVAEQSYDVARVVFQHELSVSEWPSAVRTVSAPLRGFLLKHGSEEERVRFVDLARELRPLETQSQVTEESWSVVVPAFVLTELKEAFQIGFLVFLPFLVLDLLVANVLLALGMQTLSPTQVSLAFKVLLFVAVDGWSLLARGLVLGYR